MLPNCYSRAALALSILGVGLIFVLPASAGNVTVNQIGEFDGPDLYDTTIYPNPPSYPQPSITIGTFQYTIPVGTYMTEASVSGFFGTTYAPETALEQLFVGGIQVAACVDESNTCWNGGDYTDSPITGQTPWTYSFAPSQFGVLNSGSVSFTAVQTGDFQVESGVTTLDITVAPIPEPASLAMLCGGLSLFLFLRRKRSA